MENKLSVEQIEAIQFNEVGWMGSYTFKKVEIHSPEQNVSGLTKIGDNYFKKVAVPFAALAQSKTSRPSVSYLTTLFGVGLKF
jgi:hypothetical protein